MQSHTIETIIPRLNEFRRAGLDLSRDRENLGASGWVQMQKDEKRISEILTAVHSGRSDRRRLLTADVLLRKWGF